MSKKMALAIALAGAALVGTAEAQTMMGATQNYGAAYIGISGGILIPDDLTITASGSVHGSGSFSFDSGAAVTGTLGYHFNPWLAGELEVAYSSIDFDSFSGTFTSGATTVTGATGLQGSSDIVVGLVNAIVTPFGHGSFTPYIGGGLGFANFDTSISSVGGIAVDSSGSNTDFAASAILGFDYAVTPQWSLGARYQFLWANTSSSAGGGGTTLSEGDTTANLLLATAEYHF